MSTITREFTKEQLQQIEAAAKEVMWPVVWSEKKAREHFSEKITPKVVLKLARIALASLEAEPVAYVDPFAFKNFSVYRDGNTDNKRMGREWMWANPDVGLIPVYTAPPAPVSVPDLTALDNLAGEMLNHAMNCERRVAVAYTHCAHRLAEEVRDLRAAMLQGAEPVSNRDELPLGYLQGHKDGLEWAAQLAEANHPQAGDWLYDDPIELAKAIRKGPDMPEADGNPPVVQDGWVMVPIEPTAEMLQSGISAHYERSQIQIHDRPAPGPMECAYAAMLAAAPQQEDE